jgi:hypothetical protein
MVLKSHTGDMSRLETRLEELKTLAKSRDHDQIRVKLQQIVPEYHPDGKWGDHK